MTMRYSILQSKLQELESKLHDALLLHPQDDHHDQNQTHHHADLSEDIKHKFAFIKNLLSAEISSSPPSKPHHLQHVAQRITQLEDAFLKCDSFRAFSSEELERGSSCSCTDSCFNDDGEAIGELGVAAFAVPEEFPEAFKAMVEWEETEECTESFDREKKKAMVKWEGDEEKETQKVGSLLGYEDAEDHFLEGLDHGGLIIRKRDLRDELGNDIILKSIEMRREEKIIKNNSNTSALGHICGAMACGIVVGIVFMGVMMLKFSGCFHFVDQPYFTIPT